MPRYGPDPIFRYHRTENGVVHFNHEIRMISLNGVRPLHLLVLAIYAKLLPKLCEYGWTSHSSLSKMGAAVVGVLSMVTGLLLSYRFSSALGRWDEGKKLWVALRTDIRDGIRMLSLPTPQTPNTSDSSSSSSPVDIAEDPEAENQHSKPRLGSPDKRDLISLRNDELCGLLVGYGFALQHHLHGTRPLPQPPLSELLPVAYLSSLRRTEARVRFVEETIPNLSPESEDTRPGLRRRPTGPSKPKPTDDKPGSDEWELSDLRLKAEQAVEKLSQAVGASATAIDGAEDVELRQQLSQLNIPQSPTRSASGTGTGTGTGYGGQTKTSSRQRKSNLYSPYPPNLPLALLRLMESYVVGLAEVPNEKGGWNEAKRERGLGLIKTLTQHLGHAERLSSNPPPLPLTIHLTDLLRIYLAAIPPSLMCVAAGWTLVIMSVIAGWCFLGLEALVADVGGVFGQSENHHPLPRYTREILMESLNLSPSFMRYYRDRLVIRVGEEDESVKELDRRNKKGWGEEWLPDF